MRSLENLVGSRNPSWEWVREGGVPWRLLGLRGGWRCHKGKGLGLIS